MSSVVRGERVVLPDGIRAASIHIRNGRIVDVAEYSDVPAGVRRFDAGELILLPGLVDTHVHMNDPGREDWEGVGHATRAAAAGGVTTVIDMPLNSIPPTTTLGGLAAKQSAVEGHCHVDVGLWGGVVPGNTTELRPLADGGVLGFKCFMCPSGVDEFEPVTEEDLREALPVLARLRLPLLAHAELPDHLRAPGSGDSRLYSTWLDSRPAIAEVAAIELLVRLAHATGARVHVVHLAAPAALPALRAARLGGLPLTAETCPHYLMFAAEEIPDGATAFKCAPPVRESSSRAALWQALLDGDIDMIVSDHSPAPPSLKCLDGGDFVRAWGGIASLQLGLAAIWTAAEARGISIDRVVQWMAAAPARFAGLSGMKGAIVRGAEADVVVFDPDATRTVDTALLHHRHPVTPYAGMTLRGAVRTTFLRGEIVFDGERVMPAASGRVIRSRT